MSQAAEITSTQRAIDALAERLQRLREENKLLRSELADMKETLSNFAETLDLEVVEIKTPEEEADPLNLNLDDADPTP